MKKELTFLPGQSQTLFKNIFRILQLILLRNSLNLQENVEYLQCASITMKLTSVKEKLSSVSSVSILKILNEFKTNKATGVSNLAGGFLKTARIYFVHLYLKFVIFPSNSALSQINAKSQKLILCIKNVSKLSQRTSGPSCCCHLSLRL